MWSDITRDPHHVQIRSTLCAMAAGRPTRRLAVMSYLFSTRLATQWSSSSRLLPAAIGVGRFALHFGEMVVAMMVGMLIYMPLEGFLPAVLQKIGMALFMAWPMVVWMRIRGHGWRHGFEMAGAMLLPWAAVAGLVALGAARTLPVLANASDAAMYLGMLAFMLFRRDHHASGAHHAHAMPSSETRPHRQIPWRRILLVVAYLGAILLVPTTVAGVNIESRLNDASEPFEAPAYAGTLPALPTPDPSKKIAVVLSGPRGSEIGDTLEAYEILARSGMFNVYSVAPERTVLTLGPAANQGGSSLDFVPQFSLSEYDAQVGRAPDVIAIPWWDGGYSPQRDAAELDWIRSHFGPNTTLLGICVGTEIVADTGLVAGHAATTNVQTFGYVESHAPNARWLHNVRYVDDGNIVTSSTLTAGIDATLHVVDRLAGRATALDVARQIGYSQTGALDDPAFQPPDFVSETVLTVGFEGPRQQLGILLYDGVTEMGQSGIVDAYTLVARPFAIAPERRIIRSRDGFLFLPRYDLTTVPGLDRVVVPAGENDAAKQQVIAAWSALHPGRPVEDIYHNVGFGETAYDASIRDLAHTYGATLARGSADALFYTANPQDFTNASWPVNEVVAGLALMLLGAGIVFAASHIRIPRFGRTSTQRASAYSSASL
jgi:putative intracellular protease/amidase